MMIRNASLDSRKTSRPRLYERGASMSESLKCRKRNLKIYVPGEKLGLGHASLSAGQGDRRREAVSLCARR
jgi:hypothetical protein